MEPISTDIEKRRAINRIGNNLIKINLGRVLGVIDDIAKSMP